MERQAGDDNMLRAMLLMEQISLSSKDNVKSPQCRPTDRAVSLVASPSALERDQVRAISNKQSTTTRPSERPHDAMQWGDNGNLFQERQKLLRLYEQRQELIQQANFLDQWDEQLRWQQFGNKGAHDTN